MSTTVRELRPRDVDALVALSLRAWQPVFASFAQVLGPVVYRMLFPDWRTSQADAVRTACTGPAAWVAVGPDDRPVGFATVSLHDEGAEPAGEIDLIAVDPSHQRQGVATSLIQTCLEHLRARGVHLAVIATGGDPGHQAARSTYEAVGFTALPQVRYYRTL